MKIQICGFEPESIVDGEGIRFVVFTQGCPHNCEGCHNPQSHDFKAGTQYDTEDIISMIKKNPLIQGVTLSGGEPFCQSEACLEIAKAVHQMGKNVWCYTGYEFYEIIGNPLLKEIDVLIDGKFILAEKSLDLKFRGSLNQRVIDVKESFKQHRPVGYYSAFKTS